jgi:AraC family transcriptional regulator, 4-hydroxyphenylacetate 3-monooxygenase operon regulatory protein
MRRPIPIFRNHGELFAADSCEPLVAAVGRGELELQALVHGHYPGRTLPAGALPGLKTVGYWNAMKPQTWGLATHRNEGIEVTLLESGKLWFGAGEKDYTLQPDSLTITRPWQQHQVGNPNVSQGRLHWLILDVGVRRPNQAWKWPQWIMLSPSDLAELAGILRQTEQPVWKASSEIRHCFLAIAAAVEADRKGSSLSAVTVRINELLLLLLSLLRSRKPRLDGTLTSSRATVQMFLDDLTVHSEHLSLEWPVEDMADSCGLGVTQFVHIVKQLTNMTPASFLSNCRLDYAARLLREPAGGPVTDIALACGFSSSQYFANVFRKKYGRTPTAYRTAG